MDEGVSPSKGLLMRPKISALFLVRDEVSRLRAAIESVSWADEIVVVDTGSRDGTQTLAKESGARVVEIPWEGWVISRNKALAEVQFDWVLFLDADERVTPDLAASIDAVLEKSGNEIAGITFPRLSYLRTRPVWHGTWYPDRKLRLGRRSSSFSVRGGRVHETFHVDGPIVDLDTPLIHVPSTGVRGYLTKSSFYAELAAQDRFERGKRGSTMDLVLRPVWEFFRCYFVKRGFLDGRLGFWLAACHALYYFTRASYLLEMSRNALEEQAGSPQKGPGQWPHEVSENAAREISLRHLGETVDLFKREKRGERERNEGVPSRYGPM